MRVPNVPERVKEAPAHALRGLFAGVGQALLLSDRVRRRFRDGEQESTQSTAAPPAAMVTPSAPAAAAAPPAPSKPAAATKPAATKPAAAPSTAGKTAAAAEKPPFPNYEGLSIASLRARMRGLDVKQLRDLIKYEKAHAARDDVIAMFERRISKIEETAG